MFLNVDKYVVSLFLVLIYFAINAQTVVSVRSLRGLESNSNAIIEKKYKTNDKKNITLYMNEEAYAAFVEMSDAAAKSSIDLKIKSAKRSFNQQLALWNRKMDKTEGDVLESLNYTAMPGTSRHHWGTDIDINSVDPEYFLKAKGKKELKWLLKNASQYGFCIPYNNDSNRLGYNYEAWHWSYKPVSKIYTNFVKKNKSSFYPSKGQAFEGYTALKGSVVVDEYMLGISPYCL